MPESLWRVHPCLHRGPYESKVGMPNKLHRLKTSFSYMKWHKFRRPLTEKENDRDLRSRSINFVAFEKSAYTMADGENVMFLFCISKASISGKMKCRRQQQRNDAYRH